MEEENINSSEAGTDATVNSPVEETDAEQPSEETQTSEETETPESEAEEKEINWQKRYLDTQSELTRMKQETTDASKTEMQRLREQNLQTYQEEEKKRLDVGTYMTQFKNQDGTADVAGGLNAWMNAREDSIKGNMNKMMGPVTSQTQYLAWSTAKILNKIAPEQMKEQMKHEEQIKKVLQEMPALRQFPNCLDQAEQIALSKMSKKDRDVMQKDLTKQIKKSVEQQQGVSISPSKAPTKKTLNAAEEYHKKIIEAGRQKTVL